jgi:hypothetical protein
MFYRQHQHLNISLEDNCPFLLGGRGLPIHNWTISIDRKKEKQKLYRKTVCYIYSETKDYLKYLCLNKNNGK